MATAYPGALDTTGSQLRTDISSTTALDASGEEHDVMHVSVHGATIAFETKLGLTDSNAVDGAILVGSAASTTSWTTTPTIGGNTTVSGTLTVGSDGSGHDVTFHSTTGSALMLWDASDEKLVITGTNGQNALEVADGDVSITDKLTVTGQIVTHLLVETDADAAIAPAVGDENKYVRTTHASAVVTLPQDSAQAFAIGTTIYYERYGSGTLTFAAGTGVTELSSKDGTLTCGDRYTVVAAIKTDDNKWALIGNIG